MLKKFRFVTDMFRLLCLSTLFLLVASFVSDVNKNQLFAKDGNRFKVDDFRFFDLSKKEFEKESFVYKKDGNYVNGKYSGFFYESYGDTSEIITVSSCRFDGSTFDCTLFYDISFHNCSFRNADFRGVRGLQVSGECDFTGARVHMDESRVKSRDITTSEMSFQELHSFKLVCNQFVNLSFNALQSTESFKLRNLSGVSPIDTYKGVDLSDFNLMYSCVGLTDGDGVRLDNALIRGASLHGITLEQLYSTYDYKHGKLIDVHFEKCNLENGNFTKMNLSGTIFGVCNLKNADFTDSKISWVSFGAKQDITIEHIKSLKWRDRTMKAKQNITIEQIKSTADFKNKKLLHVTFKDVVFSHVDLSGFDLNGSKFLNCNLDNVKFTDAIITNCDLSSCKPPITLEQVKSTWNYKNNHLREIDLPAEIQKQLDAEKQAVKN